MRNHLISVSCIRQYLIESLKRFPKIWVLSLKVYGCSTFKSEKSQLTRKTILQFPIRESTKKYDIVFDAQCLQLSTRERGIGNYARSLIHAMCVEYPNLKFAAFLTTLASQDDIDRAKTELKTNNPPNLDVLLIDPFKQSKRLRYVELQKNLQSELSKLNSNVVICLSNFEKPEHALSVPASERYARVGILYDLIPLKYQEHFLLSKYSKSSYFWSLNNFRSYDKLLAISQTTKSCWNDLVSSKVSVDVIYGASPSINNLASSDYRQRSGFLCVGAEQPHKNIVGLIRAYSNLDKSLREKHDLTIAGIRSSGVKKRLISIAKLLDVKIEMPEYLSSKDLQNLYHTRKVLIMPSLCEGLSLPLLEAWSCGLPTIGSKGTVAEEIVPDQNLLFDPQNTTSMTRLMEKMINDEEFWNIALSKCIHRNREFSWKRTANLVYLSIEDFIDG